MTKESKQLIIRALQSHRGDDYERAKLTFNGCSEEQMESVYGYAGKTRREILEHYAAHVAAIDQAIAEVTALAEDIK